MKIHKIIHSGEKPFQCTICDAKFTQMNTLKSHMNIHTHNKPYTCDICNKSFIQKSNMTTHRMRHSNERNFNCAYCPNQFHTKSDLLRHACCHLEGAVGTKVNLFPCRLFFFIIEIMKELNLLKSRIKRYQLKNPRNQNWIYII